MTVLISLVGEDIRPVLDYLKQAVAQGEHKVTFYESGARKDTVGYIHLPASVDETLSIYDKATVLQDLEDAWNYQESTPPYQVVLVPSASQGEL